jgi:hypothetical protein
MVEIFLMPQNQTLYQDCAKVPSFTNSDIAGRCLEDLECFEREIVKILQKILKFSLLEIPRAFEMFWDFLTWKMMIKFKNISNALGISSKENFKIFCKISTISLSKHYKSSKHLPAMSEFVKLGTFAQS